MNGTLQAYFLLSLLTNCAVVPKPLYEKVKFFVIQIRVQTLSLLKRKCAKVFKLD